MIPLKTNRPPVGAGKAAGIGNNQHHQYTTQTSAAAIVRAYGLRPSGINCWQGYCPACGYPDAFSLSINDGQLLWYCHACADGNTIQHCLQAAGLLGGAKGGFHSSASVRQQPLPPTKPDNSHLAYVRQLWEAGAPVPQTVREGYLHSRGLVGPIPPSLRLLQSCWHKPSLTSYPAIIAAVTRWPSSEVVAIHRTYLQSDCSQKIPAQAKMMLGDVRGGAVRLAEADSRLALTEGIETGLSVQQISGIPTWACLSTSGLQGIILPDAVREVLICADHDTPGLKAARAAAERLTRQGKQVKIAIPPQSGTDFNDMLKGASHD